MTDRTLQRINLATFMLALTTIALGVAIGILGVWGAISQETGQLCKLLATDAILFTGAVLTNLAIACYRKPGGAIA